MLYEIVKTEAGKFALYVQGEFVSEYTRKSSAERGYLRFVASMQVEVVEGGGCADTQADSAGAAGCGAVQPPPTSNTGGRNLVQGLEWENSKKGAKKSKKGEEILKRNLISSSLNCKPELVSTVEKHYVMVNGEVKEIPVRKGLLTAAHIDTLTVVMPRQSFFSLKQWEEAKTEDDEDRLFLSNVSEFLLDVFGFSISCLGNGRNGYKKTAEMGVIGDNRIKYGFIAWSGKEKQGDTVCLYVSGVGVTAALDGWERRLFDWLMAYAPFSKITRCDLAHDFFNGEYTPIQAYFDWVAGLFKSGNTQPVADMAGLGWLNAPDKGRTFYIGSRKNGSRVVRVYEKGIEQGDSTSLWVRFELQLRNRDIVIPLDILLYPGEYLTAAYPICETLFTKYTDEPKKTERVQKMQEISVEHCVHHMSIQASPTLKMLLEMGFNSEEVLQIALNSKAKLPKRLHPNAFDVSYPFMDFIKENKRAPYSYELQSFVSENHLNKVEADFERERAVNKVTTEDLNKFRENLNSEIYLKAAFGKGYTRELQEHMSYDEYLHIRYGKFQQKQTDLLTT